MFACFEHRIDLLDLYFEEENGKGRRVGSEQMWEASPSLLLDPFPPTVQ